MGKPMSGKLVGTNPLLSAKAVAKAKVSCGTRSTLSCSSWRLKVVGNRSVLAVPMEMITMHKMTLMGATEEVTVATISMGDMGTCITMGMSPAMETMAAKATMVMAAAMAPEGIVVVM